jgi:hypothetical protein
MVIAFVKLKAINVLIYPSSQVNLNKLSNDNFRTLKAQYAFMTRRLLCLSYLNWYPINDIPIMHF